jgi:hypothetical protein
MLEILRSNVVIGARPGTDATTSSRQDLRYPVCSWQQHLGRSVRRTRRTPVSRRPLDRVRLQRIERPESCFAPSTDRPSELRFPARAAITRCGGDGRELFFVDQSVGMVTSRRSAYGKKSTSRRLGTRSGERRTTVLATAAGSICCAATTIRRHARSMWCWAGARAAPIMLGR